MSEERAQIEKLQIANAELKEAINMAIMVIESYQLDIRNSGWVGLDLAEKGFCQGSMYLRAVPLIKQKANLPLKEWEYRVLEETR